MKTRRTLVLLDHLEEQEHTTAQTLAEHGGSSKRTVHAVIKELKDYFGETIALTGDDAGLHFSLLNPKEYMKKKQALINEEPLFLLIDYLADGTKRTNFAFAKELGISPATFSRLKRQLATIVRARYQLRLDPTTNILLGTEAAIRQFFYDVYFTLPLYPQRFDQKRFAVKSFDLPVEQNRWVFDPILVNQWLTIVLWRLEQGHILPEEAGNLDLQQRLATEWQRAVAHPLPEREQAALFVLTLVEDQFLNPLRQKEFIRCFSPTVKDSYPVQAFDTLPVALFRLMVGLVNRFFTLPQEVLCDAKKAKQTPEDYYLNYLLQEYAKEQKRINQTVFLSYDLSGSRALKQWIKQTVNDHFIKSEYAVIENDAVKGQPLVRQVMITNHVNTPQGAPALILSDIPTKDEISTVKQAFLKRE